MSEPVAVVGMAAVFPGAPDLDAYWSNLVGGVDAVTAIPPDRMDTAFRDLFETTRGGFVAPTVDPVGFGIMPVAAASAEPDQLLGLSVAAAALDDTVGPVARNRTGIVLGRGAYHTPGIARLVDRVRAPVQLATTLAELGLDAATIDAVVAAFGSRSQAGTDPIGLVPNLAASRIANRLDLRGPAYTIDAACASSLLAIDQAARELTEHRCDAMLAGGIHLCHDVTLWTVFAELGALSRSSAIRPFDRRADGIVIGEGAGVITLKRLADAERAGDRIYAVIRGAGVSSDGRESAAMRPRVDGQLAALTAAWAAADCDPATVSMVEGHGTATPAGDEVELAVLGRFFGSAASAPVRPLGSVKSMIGHAMPAAGIAGLIKTALAIHHGLVPPSLHCEEPSDALAAARFRVPAVAEPWSGIRRAGVSAFGFGGINAHVVLEAHPATTVASRVRRRPTGLAVSARSIEDLHAAIEAPWRSAAGPFRLALLDPTSDRIKLAHKVVERGLGWRGTKDIWFTPAGLGALGGKLAYVFPGVEATFAANLDGLDLAPDAAAAVARANTTGVSEVGEIEVRGHGVFALGRALAQIVTALGASPDLLAGHSIGEWTAMAVGGMVPPATVDALLAEIPAGMDYPDVRFAAIGCGVEDARPALDGLDAIAVTHDNCPHQTIVCGVPASVQTAITRLGRRGVLSQVLPFRSGFHSPLFTDYLGPHRARIAAIALQRPCVPLWSATTCTPYPDDPTAIRVLAVDHLVRPVRFRELIERLYADGVRAFVQLGVGSLAGFVDDTLRGREFLAIAAAAQHPRQLSRVACALWVDGFTEDLDLGIEQPGRGTRLDLGVPLVHLAESVSRPQFRRDPAGGAGVSGGPTSGLSGADGTDPVLAELVATLDEAAAASRAVVEAYRAGRPRVVSTVTTMSRVLSVETEPALGDHCLVRQPQDASAADRYPVVPMTMMIAMMIDAAERHAPGRVPIGLEDIHAARWLAVAPPVEVEIIARGDSTRIRVEIRGHASGTVLLADRYPAAPVPELPELTGARPAPFDARRMYDERWMFHGPRYQGVGVLGPIGDDGIDGVIDVLPAPGALLDCAGQLLGWWVMHTRAQDRLAMPVAIEHISLFSAEPEVGRRVACRVRLRQVGERQVQANLELVAGDRVWARIDGWIDRRFDTDAAAWDVFRHPERNVLADDAGAYVVVREHWRTAASRELMLRRYLGESERAVHDELGPRARRGWLLGRIAIKDAVRQYLWSRGAGPLYPMEIEVRNDASGRPVVDPAGVHVSVAHKDDVAVAIVSDRAVGIDIERIEPRSESFAALVCSAAERALGGLDDTDEWLTRLWAAKEAAAKARGHGLGDPRSVEVTARNGGRVRIGEYWIASRREGEEIVAWTVR